MIEPGELGREGKLQSHENLMTSSLFVAMARVAACVLIASFCLFSIVSGMEAPLISSKEDFKATLAANPNILGLFTRVNASMYCSV